jgi:hypothetical protein
MLTDAPKTLNFYAENWKAKTLKSPLKILQREIVFQRIATSTYGHFEKQQQNWNSGWLMFAWSPSASLISVAELLVY